ncbi:hypothetical protein [Tolumonas lignilytica]|uniref:hypothetical protein n=1 Tax=Tolumonas lignilytica TaxID=1283284 RepID=UPI000464C6BC|nr:hypothetical protein [Tolumonas lignilytica]
MAQNFNFPQISTPLVDPQSGRMTPEWMMFFISIFNIVGGGDAPQIDIADLYSLFAPANITKQTDHQIDNFLADTASRRIQVLPQQIDSGSDANQAINGEIRRLLSRVSDLEKLLGTQKSTTTPAQSVIGNFLTSSIPSGSAVSLTTNTVVNVTSLVLPAGDYDLSATVDFSSTGASPTYFQAGVSLTTATMPGQTGGSGLGTDPAAGTPFSTSLVNGVFSQVVPTTRLNLTTLTTVYLVAKSIFSVGSISAYGTLRARRFS